jgi:sirohydrochlorin ferrochelatase
MSFLPSIFLIDNGSLRPDATIALRQLAETLSVRNHQAVHAVSLLHSNKVPKEDLGGTPARTVKSTLRKSLENGERNFIFLPLFFGPSRAITEYLPQLIEEARERFPNFRVIIAEPLAGSDVSSPDIRLAEMLAERVRAAIKLHQMSQPSVTLVDHGTPYAPVNTLRNAVAAQLSILLADDASGVIASSMERREGDAYAFNEPLLERLGGGVPMRGDELICAMFFLLPGRHAGEGGDVQDICDNLVASGNFSRIKRTELLGAHPTLIDILSDRLEQSLRCMNESDL